MERKKNALIFGFVGLFLCGIGDWLIGYEPRGGQAILFGITNTRITDVPSWFYILSMAFGILSGFACQRFAPVMLEVLDEKGIDRSRSAVKAFRFGLSSAPLMFITFHCACCICLLFLKAGLKEGVSVEGFSGSFLTPVIVSLLPFTVWCFLVDIPCTVAYMALVWRGELGLPKAAMLLSPLGMSIAAKIIAAILFAVGLDRFAFLAACGESWGWAFMCLAFLRSTQADRSNLEQVI